MAEQFFIPEGVHDRHIPELFERVRDSLPIEGCSFELDPLTGHAEFVAPEGYAFRLSGEFTLNTAQNDISYWGPPRSSEALINKRLAEGSDYSEVHNDYYDARPGDFDYEPPPVPIAEFIGRRLGVSIDGSFMGAIKPESDGWKRHWLGSNSSDGDKPNVEIHVYGEKNAWYDSGGIDFIWQKGEGVRSWGFGIYWMPLASLKWQVAEAEAEFDNLQIELVPWERPEPELAVAEIPESELDLWQPKATRPTAERYFEGNKKLLAPLYEGVDFNAEIQEQLWRAKRRTYTLADDPLADIWIMEGDEYQPGDLDLDSLVSLTERRAVKPPGYTKAERIQKTRDDQRFREREIEKLKGTLVTITGSTALSALVEIDRDGRWLEREMAEYDRKRQYWDPFWE